jgi:Rps23 Pro-64 3,4-dihydroxylase Tpa1-like proline 4-hydroxylase
MLQHYVFPQVQKSADIENDLNYKFLSSSLDIQKIKENFINAKPFPHVIVDNFFETSFFQKLSTELEFFYEEKKNVGKSHKTDVEKNKWGSENLAVPDLLQQAGDFFKSSELLNFLESVTGFNNLKVTKEENSAGYSLFHVMKPGSYLGPHTDHTVDMGPDKSLYHVLNIITYVQNKWDPNWGGGTTLFDRDGRLLSTVEYRPNRALIFMHSPFSIHGTQAVSDRAKVGRMSLYFDYYSSSEKPYDHLNIEKFPLISSPHRFFLNSKIDYLKAKNFKYLKHQLMHLKNLGKYYLFGKNR